MSNERFGGPWVQSALLCEKLLLEAGNVPTFVRVVDRFTVPKIGQLPPGILVPPHVLQFTLVVMMKSGDLGTGSHTVRIRLQKPDQSYAPDTTATVFFNGGDDNGAMIALPIAIPSPEEGLHWFDVEMEGVGLISRIPMRVLFQPAILGIQPGQTPEGSR